MKNHDKECKERTPSSEHMLFFSGCLFCCLHLLFLFPLHLLRPSVSLSCPQGSCVRCIFSVLSLDLFSSKTVIIIIKVIALETSLFSTRHSFCCLNRTCCSGSCFSLEDIPPTNPSVQQVHEASKLFWTRGDET